MLRVYQKNSIELLHACQQKEIRFEFRAVHQFSESASKAKPTVHVLPPTPEGDRNLGKSMNSMEEPSLLCEYGYC
jgi:hypothetical protein